MSICTECDNGAWTQVWYLSDLTAAIKCLDCMAVEETSGMAGGRGAVPPK
jgi:hypothetical protein